MTALVEETRATVTAYSVARALELRHAVLIVAEAGPSDAHARQADDAETRPGKET